MRWGEGGPGGENAHAEAWMGLKHWPQQEGSSQKGQPGRHTEQFQLFLVGDIEPLGRIRLGNIMIGFAFLKKPFDAITENGWEWDKAGEGKGKAGSLWD